MIFAMADNGGGTGGTGTGTDAASERNSTKIVDSLETLKATATPKNYRRYVVTGPDGVQHFAVSRDPDRAISAVAQEKGGWKFYLADKGAPTDRKASKADAILAELTPEQRQALLAKYLGGDAANVAAGTPAGTAPVAPPVNATTATNPAGTGTAAPAANASAPAATGTPKPDGSQRPAPAAKAAAPAAKASAPAAKGSGRK
jgi:hypothetical protein